MNATAPTWHEKKMEMKKMLRLLRLYSRMRDMGLGL